MLRFNGRELAYLAHQPAHRFDKEGLLFIKEKQDGLFRKGEVYTERLFRLRGNMLFYFKTKDPHSEPVGVFVMERCVVELDPDEKRDFSFILAFSGDDKPVQLAAKSEPERDSWIAALHISSYECLRMQMDSLREQLRMRTGKDPIDDPDPSYLQDDRPETDTGEEPFFELCLKCEHLASESQSRMPNAFVSVCCQNPPNHHWVTYAHTEAVERNDTPSFMTTIAFSNPVKFNMDTKLRFIAYDVKEKMTSTHYLSSLRSTVKMTKIGVVILPLRELMAAPGLKMTLPLQSTDFENPGILKVGGWFNFLPEELLQENDSNDGAQGSKVHMQSLSPTTEDKMSRMEILIPLYSNIIVKTFCFPTNLGGEINVHEYMAESKLTYILPKQLLSLWVAEEQQKIQHLNDLGKLSEPWENARQELMDFHMSMITMYKQNARFLSSYQGAPFKPSSRKADKEVEFAPVNLHLQRMWVHNNAANSSGCYDIITQGAFTAYAQKYKNGGLQRMIKELSGNGGGGNSAKDPVGGGGIDTINEILNSMTMLKDAVYEQCEVLCRSAMQGDISDLNGATKALSDKTRQLLQVCDHHKIDQGVTCYEEAKREPRGETNNAMNHSSTNLTIPERNSRNPSPETTWKWSGTNFVKSPTEEPWELTRLNTEAALVCVTSKVDELIQGVGSDNNAIPQTKWLEEISSPVIKFKSCVEMTTKRVEASLTMLTIQGCKNDIHGMHKIKYRRDVVFAQALTSCVTGFMTKLLDSIKDDRFLKQISQLGVLMEFESLLTSHADEMGMLEDYAVGVQDLAHVAFKIVQRKNEEDVMPSVKGSSVFREGMFPDFNRTGYFVSIPVAESSFQKLPKEIQHGHAIRVVPVLFSIGINEHASFAERFGSIAAQEQVNLESFKRLNSYCEKYVEVLGEPENFGNHGGLIMEAIRHLSMNVMAKKSKNVEVLHRASDICRRLNGVRFSSCKSGKDRTSMSATLEQTQNLLRDHDLASHAFSHALDCMRSEGVRRDNTLKNAGVRRYAFNCLQLLSFPKLYRPPSGTYGNAQS